MQENSANTGTTGRGHYRGAADAEIVLAYNLLFSGDSERDVCRIRMARAGGERNGAIFPCGNMFREYFIADAYASNRRVGNYDIPYGCRMRKLQKSTAWDA